MRLYLVRHYHIEQLCAGHSESSTSKLKQFKTFRRETNPITPTYMIESTVKRSPLYYTSYRYELSAHNIVSKNKLRYADSQTEHLNPQRKSIC